MPHGPVITILTIQHTHTHISTNCKLTRIQGIPDRAPEFIMSAKIALLKKSKNPYLDNGCIENGYIWHRSPHYLNIQTITENVAHTTKTCCLNIVKNLNVKRCVTALILLTLGTIIYYTHYVENSPFVG